MSLTLLGIFLIGVALTLLFVEMIIPAGGMVALVAAASLVGGIIVFFQVNTTLGLVGALATMIILPFLMAGLVRAFPNTPLVQRLTLKNPPLSPTEGPPSPDEEAYEFHALIGAHGQVITDLRPIGICLINGKRLDCLADSGMIRAGSFVRVVAADAFQIKVRLEDGV